MKRLSATIYDDIRAALKQRLEMVSFDRRCILCWNLPLTNYRSSRNVLPWLVCFTLHFREQDAELTCTELSGRKTVCVRDVIFTLNRVCSIVLVQSASDTNFIASAGRHFMASIPRTLVLGREQAQMAATHPSYSDCISWYLGVQAMFSP